MPYAALKRMQWGPGKNPVVLEAGDEVPTPFKSILVKGPFKKVAEVKAIEGKKWSDQPVEAQQAWRDYHAGQFPDAALPSVVHPTQLIVDEPEEPVVDAVEQEPEYITEPSVETVDLASMSKAELLEFADSKLIAVDRRMGVDRLRGQIEAAIAEAGEG